MLTQTKDLVIPRILREPNSIIVLLFMKRSANLSFEEAICIFNHHDVISCYIVFNVRRNDSSCRIFF